MMPGRTIAASLASLALLAVSACAAAVSTSSPSPRSSLAAAADLPLVIVVPATGSALFGGPAAALTVDQLRKDIVNTTAASGNFQCVRTDCLPKEAPADSLLVVLTPSPAACDAVTALHARLTGPHVLTITVDLSIDCVGGAAAQSAAILVAVPLSSLPAGSLTVVAPGPRAIPASTTVILPSRGS